MRVRKGGIGEIADDEPRALAVTPNSAARCVA
jgi:hypothetical protein